jgi:hypothetical protein
MYEVMVEKVLNYRDESFEVWGSRQTKLFHFEMALFL